MKTVFVVLLLFVGCNSGDIVASVASKAINKSTSNSTDTKEILKEMNLEKSNKIHEKELLQTSADKESSLNERSFIFINQRFKTPLRNQLYNSQTHNLNKPFTISERLPQVNAIPSTSEQVSPLKELFIPNIKNIKSDVNLKSSPSYINQHRELRNKYNDHKYALPKEVQENITKPNFRPLNISYNKKSSKTTPDSNPQDSIKPYQSNKHQDLTSYARQRINYNYGFPMFQKQANNDLFSMADDTKRSLVTDNTDNLSPLDLTDEGDKLLERYIKETLKEFDINDLTDSIDVEKYPKLS